MVICLLDISLSLESLRGSAGPLSHCTLVPIYAGFHTGVLLVGNTPQTQHTYTVQLAVVNTYNSFTNRSFLYQEIPQ